MVCSITVCGHNIQLITPLLGLASQSMDSTLSLDGETADHKKQKSLPPHITTPRRGPLLLKKLQASKSPQTELPSCLKEKKCRSQYQPQAKVLMSGVRVCIPARGCGFLTRYPVVVTPRPMDVIEDQLLKGEVTWSQLKYNVQLMTVSVVLYKKNGIFNQMCIYTVSVELHNRYTFLWDQPLIIHL